MGKTDGKGWAGIGETKGLRKEEGVGSYFHFFLDFTPFLGLGSPCGFD